MNIYVMTQDLQLVSDIGHEIQVCPAWKWL